MRTIGFIISVLLLWPVTSCHEAVVKNDRADSGIQLPALLPSPFAVQKTTQKNSGTIDTGQLKQSNWYADAIRSIEESEYEIKQVDKSRVFASPNRQQDLRAFYTADKFTLEPRADDNWKLELTVKGIYSGKKKIYSPKQNAIAVTNKNNIRFNHNNEFTVEYINSKEGVRQNFIIEKEPAAKPQTLNIKLQTNRGWFINQVHPKEIHFAKTNRDAVEKKLTYNELKVWDANYKELEATFSVIKNEISINVVTDNAVYPITIDPLSTAPNSTLDDCNQANANFGISVSSAGDVNGDGYSDVIIGAYSFDGDFTDEGQAFVYHGSATGLSTTPNNTPDDADLAFANFGYSVASAGDVNGDGYSDVIIGAYGYNDAGNNGEGRAYVYHGSSGGVLANPAITLDDANQAFANYGYSVASAGDVNGDGYSDVIIGAQAFNDLFSLEGRAYVHYGSNTGLSSSIAWIGDDADQTGALFGKSVACAGDVNGDGYSDVIIGASWYDGTNTNEGQTFVYHGSASGLSLIPDWIGDDANQDDAFSGVSVACAGDINGDGYSDVIIGTYLYNDGFTDEGVAFVYYGSSTGLSANPDSTPNDGDQANTQFGVSVACAGDVNGDGYSDVIIGAWTYDDSGNNDEGRAFIYLGSSTGLSATPNETPDDADAANAQFGISVASAGDVNGDGYSDVIIGANGYDDGANTDEGWAFVYQGGPDGLSATFVNTPDDADQSNAYFGINLACAGDVNADGFSDVVIAAYGYDDGPNADEGVVFVYHGSISGLSASPNSMLDDANQANALFGSAVASAGDVNGDGYSDVIVGAAKCTDGGNAEEGRAFLYFGSATGLSATPDNTLDDADQAGAWFGFSVASAGDVNGDGYSDVIIGALYYDDSGNINEGRAFLYYGSGTGLSASPDDILDDANQANAEFGCSVASAGDVNGDGFSDVIIGAWNYDDTPNTNEGWAFVYHGSSIGLPATPNNTPDDANQASAYFGWSVASAGDVNGDGYGDVIIGAYEYDGGNSNEGRAFVYHGSSLGLSATPNSTLDDANQNDANFGLSVASAGDVNGDGYSDVIIGAYKYTDGGNTFEGRAFVYHGSASGLSATPNSTPDDADQNLALSACSVAGAGDINGDGYSDVIIGAYNYTDAGNTGEGRAFVYYGNNTGGLRNNLRLYNSDLVTPMQQSNMNDPNLFGAGLYAKSFLGRQKGRLVWETVKNGQPFSGTTITNSTAYTAQTAIDSVIDLTGKELKHQIAKQLSTKATYIRARVRYSLTTAITGQVYGPWKYPESFLRGRRDVGSVALPVKFISFTAIKGNSLAKLKWITNEEEPGVRFEVQHSIDGTTFTTLSSINGRNQVRNEYEWLHSSPAKGNNFYRIKAIEQNKQAFTVVRMLYFGNDAVMALYPNPVAAGQVLTIENDAILQNEQLFVSLSCFSGQAVFEKNIKATENGKTTINLPVVPSGAYLLLLRAGQREYRGKIVLGTK